MNKSKLLGQLEVLRALGTKPNFSELSRIYGIDRHTIKKYWIHGMAEMKNIRPDMEFMIITDDVVSARKMLPGIPAHHFDIGKDYVTLKNAHYLLLSNSSFACLPAHTSETLKFAIAPKYWARHNVSDGYWASEQNIYSLFHYMDRKGKLFTAKECREELERYKEHSSKYARRNKRPGKVRYLFQNIRRRLIYGWFYLKKIQRAVIRRLKGQNGAVYE